MNRKQRRHPKAAPLSAGGSQQQPEQQSNVQGVQQNADKMMARGIQAEQLAIEHVGDPSERVPVGNIESSERPTDVLEREAGLNVRIEGDVGIVIVVNESIAGGGIVERQGAGDEQQRQDGLLPTAGL